LGHQHPVTDRWIQGEWSLIARDPGSHAGETYVVHGVVTQFDVATGPAAFRANVDGVIQTDQYGYTTNTYLTGDASALAKVVVGDVFAAKVVITGLYSYADVNGGYISVPELAVDSIQGTSPLPATSATGQQPSSAQAQAAAVDQLLGQATISRQQVLNAVAMVQQCNDSQSVSAAQSALTQASQDRQSLVTQVAALDVSQLPSGAAAMQTLSRAWTESAAADAAYAAWAGAMANGGCKPGNAPHNSDWDTGTAQSGNASLDKNTFVAAWTPIAMQYNLPTRSADAI
jgi:hypothetical protein